MKILRNSQLNAKVFLKLTAILLVFGGCTSQFAPAQTANPPYGLVYYRSEQIGQYETGAFYYYDLKQHRAWRLTQADKAVFGYTRSISWSSGNQSFIYVAGRDSRAEIFATDLEGRNHKRLTVNEWEDARAYWSPNGKKIAFLSRAEDNALQRAYIMNADGTELRALIKDPQVLSDGIVRWSPDNRWIAVLGLRIEEQSQFAGQVQPVHMYVVDVENGAILHQLTDESVHLNIDWSPDSQHLAYISDLSGKASLYIWDLNTGEHHKVVDIEGVLTVDWSPDGQWLAFIAGQLEEKFHLYITQPDGQNLTDLTPDHRYVVSEGVDMWSSESRCLAFSGTAKGQDDSELQWDVYVVDIVSKETIQLTDDPNYEAGGSWVSLPGSQESCELAIQEQ